MTIHDFHYIIPLPKGREARVHINSGPQLDQSWGILFDDADLIETTDTTGFNGYCHAEIAAKILHELDPHLTDAQIDTAIALVHSLPACTCDLDDEED